MSKNPKQAKVKRTSNSIIDVEEFEHKTNWKQRMHNQRLSEEKRNREYAKSKRW